MSFSTSLLPFDPLQLKRAEQRLQSELSRRQEIARLESSLIEFVRAAWPHIDSSEYQESWAIEALCDHLQAVADGKIRKLLINVPPRTGKTLVSSVCFPAWCWARRKRTFWTGPGVKFLCGSYNHTLSLNNSTLCRRLIQSEWYQQRWGKQVVITEDQNSKFKFDTTENGSRQATSVSGSLLGLGGDIILIDDPHNTEEVESEADRERAKSWWSEIRSTRLNDPKLSAIVVIMQRLHQEDVSGLITSGEDYEDWVHLMLPMRHDVDRHCVTEFGEMTWEDPRVGAELLWPDRFGDHEVELLERELGPYLASGRLQQSPSPKGGGIIKSEWWNLWEEEKYPAFDFIVASADTAFTKKEENDPTGFTIWGVFRNEKSIPSVMLIWAWEKRCELHGGDSADQRPKETRKEYFERMKGWGLVEWIAYSCRRFKVDRLLIENKASGKDVANEMVRLYREDGWSVELIDPVGDKTARLHSVEPAFSNGMVYAPDEEWAEKVITQLEQFPKAAHDDLVDSTSAALSWLRRQGLIRHQFEIAAEMREEAQFRPQEKALYDV